MTEKVIIYQLLPRLFTNYNPTCAPHGDYKTNGSGKLNDINADVLGAIRDLGITHVWLTGVIEHAQCTDYSAYGIERDNRHVVKGEAGSPYAIKDYYDIDPDLAVDVPKRMKEFEALVSRIHKAGMKVVIDFVPNHVARQYRSDAAPKGVKDLGADDDTTKAFSPDNNFYYNPYQQFAPHFDLGSGGDAYVEFPAKATGNDCFSAFPGVNDWYETVKLNYGVDYLGGGEGHFDPIPSTWKKMLDILLFWASKGVDAFRCDMAFMVPLEFWAWAVPQVKAEYPAIQFIAEIYDTNLYHDFIVKGGFDYLYDKVNLYDTLRGIQTSNVSAASLTGCWQTVDGLAPHMLNFLENHDEQRYASAQYCSDPAKVIPALVVSSMIGTGPMMIYMGQELGETAPDAEGFSGRDGRTTIFDYWSLSTLRRWLNEGKPGENLLTGRERWLRDQYRRILTLCNSEKAIAEGGFFDVMYVNYQNPTINPHRHYIFMRHAGDETIMVAVNFSADSADMQINIPDHAFDYFKITPGRAEMTELLTGEQREAEFAPGRTFDTFVAPFGAAIWKVKHKKSSPKVKKTVSSGRPVTKK